MFGESIDAVLKGAESKLGFMKSNPLGYFMASAIAGMFITFGSMISMSIGGYLTALMGPAAKIGAAIAFAAALSMVITAGCELFTGNNLTVGMLGIDKPRRWGEIAGLWAYCWLGNLVGSWITIAVYHYAGADTVACVSQYFAKVSASKVSFTPLQMVLRGILCNVLVCLAVWCAVRLKEESAKLIMTVWCILVFMVCGFEHSVANMSIIGIALLNPCGEAITWAGYAKSLGFVTLGNILGAVVMLALPYYLMVGKREGGR